MGRSLRFPVTIALSAFLLFQVQPIMGRYVLPWFGGGPAVWTNCLLFFQALLLAGYAYAHWLGSRPNLRQQSTVHIVLLLASLVFLPIGPRADIWRPASSADPSGRILLLLAATVGGPYLLLSSTGPLLQRWFHLAEPGRSPWRLYALSNLGSFVALLSYPFLMEPFLRLHTEVAIWSVLYAGFVAVCAFTAWRAGAWFDAGRLRAGAPATKDDRLTDSADRPTWRTLLFWLGLSAAGSTVLLATTNQISQEIAVNPFLWVAPLAIYLLTFVLTFERDRTYHRIGFAVAAGVLAPAGCIVQSAAVAMSVAVQLLVFLAALFIGCMVCHGELARSRPSPGYLTTFYLTIAAGGALGGVFVALIAPRVFTEFSEYPVGLAAACLLGFAGWAREGALAQWTSRNFAVRLPLMALLIGGFTAIVAATTAASQPALAKERSFYGILRVSENIDLNGLKRELKHGRILHGFQYVKSPKRGWPTTYYGPHSGVARALNALDRPNRRVAVVGLGAGTLAAWGRPGDTFRFYEINPEVEEIARTWFSYLSDSPAHTEVVLGDARVQLELELARGQSHDFDVIAVDAFSSDAIPIHLLTAECADIYARHLAPGGLLLLHISNLVLNLEPVAEGLAQHLGWKSVFLVSPPDPDTGESGASWMLVTSNAEFLEKSGLGRAGVQWTGKTPAPIAWTDDFASLWHVLDFRR
jgi:hypothetical protein